MLIFAPPRSGCRDRWPPSTETLVSRPVLSRATEMIRNCIRLLISRSELLLCAWSNRAVAPFLKWHRGCHFELNGGQSQARAEASGSGNADLEPGDAKFHWITFENLRQRRLKNGHPGSGRTDVGADWPPSKRLTNSYPTVPMLVARGNPFISSEDMPSNNRPITRPRSRCHSPTLHSRPSVGGRHSAKEHNVAGRSHRAIRAPQMEMSQMES